MTKPFVVLGCGKEKREERGLPIVDLYTGPLYRDRLDLARRLGGPHLIVSAFFGARLPDYEAHPYDRTIDDLCKEQLRWFNADVARSVLLHSTPGQEVVVLASKPYWQGWAPDVERGGRTIVTPLAGLGLGKQRRRCRELADGARNLELFGGSP